MTPQTDQIGIDRELTRLTPMEITAGESERIDELLTVAASLDLTNAVYVSTPITSGPLYYRLLAQAARSLADDDASCLLATEVREPNLEAAAEATREVRLRYPGSPVINPSLVRLVNASQNLYNAFWAALIERHVARVVAADGWPLSSGARMEVYVALRLGRPVESQQGAAVAWQEYDEETAKAADELRSLRFGEDSITDYLTVVVPPAYL
ncbi:MAG: hypothetical protein GY926_27445 [bacterium]|nr:hypothetical protein [bacterium]